MSDEFDDSVPDEGTVGEQAAGDPTVTARYFGSTFGMMFGAYIPTDPSDLSQTWPRTTEGPYGLAPYGDKVEHMPAPTLVFTPDTWRPFWPTDARSAMIILDPNHMNFIPNPAMRWDLGWNVAGFAAWEYSDDSWVGRSINAQGAGTINYQVGDSGTRKFVYVGPTVNPDQLEWSEQFSAGSEYTFSVYAKGSGYMQLVMSAYNASDPSDITSDLDPAPMAVVASPYFSVNTDDWERFYVKTTSRLKDVSDDVDDFQGAYWVDCQVIVYDPESAIQFSAFMLDPTEGQLAEYFDGDLDEPREIDDYLWLGDPNGSPTLYYYDRLVRSRWLYRNLYAALPAGMPAQIFFHDERHPFIPEVMMPDMNQVSQLMRRNEVVRVTSQFNAETTPTDLGNEPFEMPPRAQLEGATLDGGPFDPALFGQSFDL